MTRSILEKISFDANGLVPAIAQQHDTGEVLMMAWMNADAVQETLAARQVCYWSRSRGRLWRKGESSGHVQKLVDFRIDCDGDTLLLLVDPLAIPAAITVSSPACGRMAKPRSSARLRSIPRRYTEGRADHEPFAAGS